MKKAVKASITVSHATRDQVRRAGRSRRRRDRRDRDHQWSAGRGAPSGGLGAYQGHTVAAALSISKSLERKTNNAATMRPTTKRSTEMAAA